jgi:hypothetical protein
MFASTGRTTVHSLLLLCSYPNDIAPEQTQCVDTGGCAGPSQLEMVNDASRYCHHAA